MDHLWASRVPEMPEVSDWVTNTSQKTAILDSNLLVLLITFRLGLPLISFKRVKTFTEQDVRLLMWLLSQFKGVATTSYVLAETSNLANELSGAVRNAWYKELATFATVTNEAHVATQTLGSLSETVRFGVADSALSYLSERYTLITSEYRLSGYLQDLGRQVLNFNHFRSGYLLN